MSRTVESDEADDGRLATRGRIITAAMAAFADRGVEATSLDAIAGAVGVRKQTLLYWFASKQDLLFAVIDRVVADLGSRLGAASANRPPERRLTAVVDATFRVGAAEPELLAVVRELARLGPPATTRLVAAAEPLLAGAMAALVDDGTGVAAAAGGERCLTPAVDRDVRAVLLAAGARVVAIVTEAEVRADLGVAVDLAWLRSRRRDLLDLLEAGI